MLKKSYMIKNVPSIGCAPVNIVGLYIENVFSGGVRVEHVTGHRVQHPFRLPRRAASNLLLF